MTDEIQTKEKRRIGFKGLRTWRPTPWSFLFEIKSENVGKLVGAPLGGKERALISWREEKIYWHYKSNLFCITVIWNPAT